MQKEKEEMTKQALSFGSIEYLNKFLDQQHGVEVFNFSICRSDPYDEDYPEQYIILVDLHKDTPRSGNTLYSVMGSHLLRSNK
jgi:hypothetical protein